MLMSWADFGSRLRATFPCRLRQPVVKCVGEDAPRSL